MHIDDYIIRPPQTREEWDEIPDLLLDYRNEFDDKTCFTSFEEEIADIENVYNRHRRIQQKNSGLCSYADIIPWRSRNEKIICNPFMSRLSPGRKSGIGNIILCRRKKIYPLAPGYNEGDACCAEIVSTTWLHKNRTLPGPGPNEARLL